MSDKLFARYVHGNHALVNYSPRFEWVRESLTHYHFAMHLPTHSLARYVLILGLIQLSSCFDDPPVSATITGEVMFDGGGNASNVSITLDGNPIGQTGSSGEFTINANFGKHVLQFVSGELSGLYSLRSFPVDFPNGYPDVSMGILQIPNPVELILESQDEHGIHLKWDPSAATDFRKYQLFMSEQQEVARCCGRLLETTDQNRTDFSITDECCRDIPFVVPGHTYYFRLFVMNDSRILGASTVLAVTQL